MQILPPQMNPSIRQPQIVAKDEKDWLWPQQYAYSGVLYLTHLK